MKRTTFVASAAAAAFAPARAAARGGGASPVLSGQLQRIAIESSGTLAVYARKMDRSPAVAYNADVVFPTASISKVLILLALFQRAERHPAIFRHRIVLVRSDFVGGSEILDSYNIGQSITIDTLAHAMIEQSDNSASNVLINYLGMDTIAATIRAAGLRNTQLRRHYMDVNAIMHHSENLTTARDMGTLLHEIERGAREGIRTVASPQSCRAMIAIMLRQEDRDKIARGLPKGTPLANKSGEIDGVRNDVGIVDPLGDDPYVIAVLTKNLNDFSLGNIAIRKATAAVNSAFR